MTDQRDVIEAMARAINPAAFRGVDPYFGWQIADQKTACTRAEAALAAAIAHGYGQGSGVGFVPLDFHNTYVKAYDEATAQIAALTRERDEATNEVAHLLSKADADAFIISQSSSDIAGITRDRTKLTARLAASERAREQLLEALEKLRIGLNDPIAGEDPTDWVPLIDAALADTTA